MSYADRPHLLLPFNLKPWTLGFFRQFGPLLSASHPVPFMDIHAYGWAQGYNERFPAPAA